MRLLLIEDDEVLRTTLAADLERAGFVVDGAADGETGEFLGATEHYDIAVLDLGLPRLPGLAVLRRWRACRLSLPVIVRFTISARGRPAQPSTAPWWPSGLPSHLRLGSLAPPCDA